MRTLTWIALLTWAAFLYWGVKASSRSATPCTLSKDLPQNHLLTAKDLMPVGSDGAMLYSGLYLKKALPKDSQLKPEDVGVSPLLIISPGSALFTLELSRDDAAKRDADQQLNLGIGSTVIASRLIAVLCPSRAGGKCQAAFEVPQSQLKPLVDAAAPVGIVDTPSTVSPQPAVSTKKDAGKLSSNKPLGKRS